MSWYKTWQHSGYKHTVWNRNFPGNVEEHTKVLGVDKETKSHLSWQFFGIWKSLWRPFVESLYVDTTQIWNTWDCWKSSAQSKGRHLCCIVAIRSEWKLVGKFHGMLLLSAKYSRRVVGREDIWKSDRNVFQRTSDTVWSNGRVSSCLYEREFAIASVRLNCLARYSSRLCVVRGENPERRHHGRRNWRIG